MLENPTSRKVLEGQAWWLMSVIPATWEVESGGSHFKARPGKNINESLSQTSQVVVHTHLPAMKET
jgi:hypothetical protein